MLTNAPQVAETCRRAVGEASDLGSIGKHLVMSRPRIAVPRETSRERDPMRVALHVTGQGHTGRERPRDIGLV
jgi:hypothetical protein